MRPRLTTWLTRFSGILLAAALVAGRVPAQQPDPADEPQESGTVEEVEVRLVQLPIIAQDRNGNPIADLTDPSSIPHELATVVPFLRTTPVLPLRLQGAGGYSMCDDLKAYPWVLDVHEYESPESLFWSLDAVLVPAEVKVKELRR